MPDLDTLPSEMRAEGAGYSGLPIAVDTETNGLYADDGARVAVVSVAWMDPEIVAEGGDRLARACATGLGVRSVAWPFAQTKIGKAEDDGERSLFEDDDPNLPEAEWVACLDWLADSRLVMHNAKFDLEKLRVGTMSRPGVGQPEWPGLDLVDRVIWDTQIANKEIWPTEMTTSLKPTASRLWGESEGDEQRALKPYLGPKTDPRFDLVPWEVLGPYAAKDAELTIRLFYYQQLLLEEGDEWLDWYRREERIMRVLYAMEAAGLPYDAALSLDMAAELRKRQEALDAQLPFKPTGHQARDFFFSNKTLERRRLVKEGGRTVGRIEKVQGLDLLPYSVTDSGTPQLTAANVDRLIADYDETTEAGRVARIWRDRTKIDTACKMWYEPYAEGIGADGRLRTNFRQVTSGRGDKDGGTRSGRFSVERVNLQAIPHDYRLGAADDSVLHGIATPRQIIGAAAEKLDGWSLWEFDLEQAELRVAALWAGCRRMIDAIHNGDDLHGITARELFNVDKDTPGWDQYRQVGKRGNFTLLFGAGWLTFQRMVAKETGIYLSDADAERTVRDWNALYPEYKRAIDRESLRADRLMKTKLVNGRYRYYRYGEDTHKAFNQKVQGSLAELGKDWLLAGNRLCEEWDLRQRGLKDGVGQGGLLLPIHDSQVWLLPDDEADWMSEEIREAGVSIWKQMFPGMPGGIEGKEW